MTTPAADVTSTTPHRRLNTVIRDGLHFAPITTGEWRQVATYTHDRTGQYTITCTDGATLHLRGVDTITINLEP